MKNPPRLLDFHYKYANGGRQNELDETSAYWAGPSLDDGVVLPQFGYPEGAELKSYPNNMKEFLQTGITSNNGVALSGGNDNGNFRVSFNNMSMKGMIPDHDRFNNNLKTSLNYNINSKLKFESNISIARTWSNNIPSTGDRNNNPLEAVYQSSYISMDLLKDYWLPGQEQIAQNRPPDGDNPYFLAKAIDNSFVRDRIYGNLGLTYSFSDALSLRVRYNLDRYTEERETRVPFSANRMPKGNYTIENIFYQEANTEALLTYTKQLSDFDISISAGGNLMNRNGNNSRIGSGGDRNNGLVIPGLYTVGNIPLTNISVGSSEFEKAIYSVYGLASIGYKNQLYLDLTARNDWSSTLPIADNQNSYFYPSASLSWLANYSFDLPENISLLKLRGGWAQVGNDTDPYRLQQTLGLGTWNTLTTESVPSTLLNPGFKT
ncbi:MAG: TonB-dependent receptor [Cyclobacteriaceae bacterium]|nr:TonB-dependent receptor [Cyclobacteriaceae bacterium]